MGRADPIGALGWIAWPLFGALAGVAATLALDAGLGRGAMAMAGLCALPLGLVFGPRLAMPAVLFAVVALEEFPSGLGEQGQEGVDRSTRTPFYSMSLGLGGLYAPDVLLLGAIGVVLAHAILHKRNGLLRLDAIGWTIALMMFMAGLSALLSLSGANPFVTVIQQDDATTPYDANAQALAYIGLFQFKNYALLLAGYVGALLHVDRRSKLNDMVAAVLLGVLALYAFGIGRLIAKPSIITRADPLFYDSPSSLIFALVVFYALAGWGFGIHSWRRTLWQAAVAAVAVLFILVSYRRAMWGGIALSGLIVVAVLPRPAQVRLLVWGSVAAIGLGAAVMASPLGGMLLERVVSRIGATSIADTSTLYRIALFVHFLGPHSDVPLFGYGVTPLWTKFFYFSYLRFNLENVHSLYFWLYLRTGPIGFVVAMAGYAFILLRLLAIFFAARDGQFKAIAICLFTAVLITLFSGIFNPVYGEARYMLPLGLALGMATRLGQMSRLQRTGAAP